MNPTYRSVMVGVAVSLALIGAGCASSSSTSSSMVSSSPSTTTSANGLITVASPKPNDSVSDKMSITGKSPVGQTIFAAAVVNDNPVSLTLGQPDEAGNFSLPSLGLDAVLAGDFSLVVYNINDNGDWLNQVTIPLHLK